MDPADLPPPLEWESAVWEIYAQVSTQWNTAGMSGIRTGLAYGPAIELMKARGWNLDLGIALIGAIEREHLEWDAREREQQNRD